MNARTLFLLDGIGATLSLLVTGFVLPRFSEALGLSPSLLHTLAFFPAVYLVFSFSCYRLAPVIRRWMLLTIILANAFYCLLSASVLLFHDGITIIGRSLLAGEILVVLGVVVWELKVFRSFQES